VVADKGYEADAIVPHGEASGAQPLIPPRAKRTSQRADDKPVYKQPNRLARCFSRRKHFRRRATRCEKNQRHFHSLLALACWMLLLG